MLETRRHNLHPTIPNFQVVWSCTEGSAPAPQVCTTQCRFSTSFLAGVEGQYP